MNILYYNIMTQNTSNLTSEIYKSRQVVLELMNKQGYNINDHKDFSINEINTLKANNQLDMFLTQNDEDVDTHRKRKIYIRYYLAKPLRPANLRELIDDLFNTEQVLTTDDILYIVVKDEVNDTLLSNLKHIWETDNILVIIQPIKRLQFNILEHILVPPYRILSKKEEADIRTQYNIMSDAQFPDLSRFDPIAKAICVRPGQVCEIIRPSKTAIYSKYYRLCR